MRCVSVVHFPHYYPLSTSLFISIQAWRVIKSRQTFPGSSYFCPSASFIVCVCVFPTHKNPARPKRRLSLPLPPRTRSSLDAPAITSNRDSVISIYLTGTPSIGSMFENDTKRDGIFMTLPSPPTLPVQQLPSV